jgi:DNA-binding transcriptional regulator YiaG
MSKFIDEVRIAKRLPPPAAARAIRESAGVSQAALAAQLGVARLTVSRWEAGTRKPRRPLAVAYARLLDELREAT